MYDLIIQGGRIISGSGDPWYYGDVGVRGDRIAALGKLTGEKARRIINAAGKMVSPGFIDMHSHSDTLLLANPKHEVKIMQGVTTEVIGVDGLSYAPLSESNLQMMRRYLAGLNGNPNILWDWSSVSEYLARFDYQVATNVVYLIPHNALRLECMGFVDRPATTEELRKMQQLTAQGMEEGAVGVSFGLDYYPGRYCNTEELTAICDTVAQYDGISVWHVRIKDLNLIDGVKEALRVAEETNVNIHVSHYATQGIANKGKSKELLEMVDAAREKGYDVTFDSYPYTVAASTLILLLPGWVHEGGPDAMLERLTDSKVREEICAELNASDIAWDELILSSLLTEENASFVGCSLQEGAKMAGMDVAGFTCKLLLDEKLDTGFLTVCGNEEDIRKIFQHPCHSACSDGILLGSKPNPRGWGSFPRFLAHYGRDLGLLRIEEIIRHMTSAPAQRLGLHDRGIIKRGLAADLVVFDPVTVRDMATIEEPTRTPVGIDYVVVNGAIVVDNGKHTGMLNGRSLIKS